MPHRPIGATPLANAIPRGEAPAPFELVALSVPFDVGIYDLQLAFELRRGGNSTWVIGAAQFLDLVL